MNNWATRFRRLKILGSAALIGLSIAVLGYSIESSPVMVAGMLVFAPGFVYIYVITILHWKDRYIGTHSDAWGAWLLLESTGWSKLVYVFRHVLADARSSGRYAASIQHR
jgi:hypothetical protein